MDTNFQLPKRTPALHRLHKMRLEAQEAACLRLGKEMDSAEAQELAAYRKRERKPMQEAK